MNTIKMIVLDVDGVLTDGSIYLDASGNELKAFNAQDGLGIKLALKAGLKVVFLTSRKSLVAQKRAEELKISSYYDDIAKKATALSKIARDFGIDLGEIAFVGDDVVDLPAMKLSGLAIAPSNARKEIKDLAGHVTKSGGGNGAVREAIEYLLKKSDQWDKVLAKYYEEIGA